ncbi:MAG: beta-N-acetylhexosaminidase [Gammaproteobacteria bacterium]|jgi:beta-N-acetylhexosaminidase|nr:beta-N-acetylhexosaminidase [Gammaproteobacteria bacterium]
MENKSLLGPLMIGLQTTRLVDEEKKWLSHEAVGGVILFSRNYTDKQQLIALVTEIRQIRSAILIAVDQEGGRIQRFQKEFTPLPSLHSLGLSYDKNPDEALKSAEEWAYLMASELLACGIDISFAPVLDCHHTDSTVLAERTFHQDPAIVATLGKAYIQGMHEAGMIAVAKHFPGHGGVSADSHTSLPVDNRTLEALLKSDLIPFISTGLACEAMMVAHILFPQIDEMPAGYSAYWLKHLLRDTFHFKGVIFSDDLGMEGGATVGDAVKRVELALAAGCDMVLLCNDPEAIENVVTAFSKKVLFLPTDSRLQACRAAPDGLYDKPAGVK